jgi:hypothetical protein
LYRIADQQNKYQIINGKLRQFLLPEQANGHDDKKINSNGAENDPDVVILKNIHHKIHLLI